MNPRNMQSNNRIIEFEVAQQMQYQQHQEPYILLGGSPPNFPQSSTHQILPTSGNISNLDGTALYRLPQYAHQMHPVTNPELGIPAPSTFYNPYLIPASGTRMFSAMDQLPSSSNFGPTSAHVSGYGVNGFPPNVFRGSSKRNGTEGFMGNNQYFNSPPAPSPMAMPPMNVGHFDPGIAIVDACFPLPEFRGNYVGQSFRPPTSTWCERHPVSPYFEMSNITGASSEMGNIGGPMFHESTTNNRGSQNLPRYTPMLHPLPEFHPPQAVPHYHPLPATNSSRQHPVNNRMQHVSHPPLGPDALPSPNGIRIFRSHRRSVTPVNPNLPHLRLLEEGVAILEFSGHYEMSSSTVDHHRDMRLDIDYMSYEELLALSERIGNVKTGLSEDSITAQLKTRVHRSSIASINLEELPSIDDDKNDSCVICQDEYEDNDKIGSLDCGHEYHVNCLKKWLPVKNTCPICKSTALNEDQKKSDRIQ